MSASDHDEVTGIRDLPIQVKPFAISMAARHQELKGQVSEMKPKVDALHDNSQRMAGSLKVILWLVVTLLPLTIGHLIATLLGHR